MMANWPKYTKTRFVNLGVTNCAPRLWRYVCLDWNSGGTSKETPACVGPQFKTKIEAMAYLAEYAEANYPER